MFRTRLLTFSTLFMLSIVTCLLLGFERSNSLGRLNDLGQFIDHARPIIDPLTLGQMQWYKTRHGGKSFYHSKFYLGDPTQFGSKITYYSYCWNLNDGRVLDCPYSWPVIEPPISVWECAQYYYCK